MVVDALCAARAARDVDDGGDSDFKTGAAMF